MLSALRLMAAGPEEASPSASRPRRKPVPDMSSSPLASYAQLGIRQLREEDPELYDLLEREHRRQSETLAMIAAASVAPRP
ncbi:hypothetical protein ACFQ2B_05850 [Streptomyces stramineus]